MSDAISLEDESNGEIKNYTTTNFRRNVKRYFADYSDKTTIYGIKYLNEPNRSLIEKLYWIIVLCILFIICTVLIAQTWNKWNESPVTNFVHSSTPLWQIPFPAVTICPETKIKQSKYNFTNYFNKIIGVIEETLTEEEKQKFSDAALVCDSHLYGKGNKTTETSVFDYLIDAAPQLEEALIVCKINMVNESCTKMFSPIVTDDGICFTFNMLDKQEFFTSATYLHQKHADQGKRSEGWSLATGYPANLGRDTYPKRAIAAGARGGMFLLLKTDSRDMDYICRGPIQGFKVILHHPAELPRLETRFIQVPVNQSVVVTITPNMLTTSPALKSYDPQQRNCFFSEERPLKFFKTYTEENCHAECVADHILDQCGCVPFYLPHTNSTKVCGSGSIQCMHNAHNDILFQQVEGEISDYNSGEMGNPSTKCNCLPACTTIRYNTEISHTELFWPQIFEAFKVELGPSNKGVRFSRLTVLFKERMFTTIERKKLYSNVDFWAHCGGLLSLFIGFSVFSIFEFVYFLSLRLMCNIRKYGQFFWSGSRNLLDDM